MKADGKIVIEGHEDIGSSTKGTFIRVEVLAGRGDVNQACLHL